MSPAEYRRAIEGQLCLGRDCRAGVATTRGGGRQRQCPDCRRKWSFDGRRRQLRLLDTYATGMSVREAAAALSAESRGAAAAGTAAPAVTPPTVQAGYDRFRRAVAEAHALDLAAEVRRRCRRLKEPWVEELVRLLAGEPPGGGEDGDETVVLVAGGYVVFVPPDEEVTARSGLARVFGGPVERAGLAEFFSATRLGPGRPVAERIRSRVRGGARVAGPSRRAAVCEAAAWAHRSAINIFGQLYARLFDPDAE
ncbi:hypothetical protein [Urbifossiella limnaea]|uniref:Uncharacterized protein n=1 Tax=Urbifossiella limnaea TaxID=2528023 RepID=A0A517XWD2_9BACT|nr:hypothetical protein [Urbifossiella limnaea]QDU21821.1 hypothetical protein ETAA1_37940 [Urbifossiella limnaea]